jgi:type IV pilus assembly protein PilF
MGLILILQGCQTDPSTQNKVQLAEIDTELAVLDLNQHQPESAKVHLLDAKSLAPDDALVLAGEGFYDLQIHEVPAAAEFYQRAIAIAPHNPDIQNDYGVFLYRTKAYQQALPYFVQAAYSQDNLYAGEAFENAGLTELKLGDAISAQAYFRAGHLQE